MLEPVSGGTPLLFLLLGAAAASASLTVVLVNLSGWLYAKYSQTIGRRRVQARKLRRLACGVRAEYIEEVIGEPALLGKRYIGDPSDGRTARTYVLPDAFVRLICSDDSVVDAFSVTTRNRWFAPRLEIPWGGSRESKRIIRLGRTRYSGLSRDCLISACGWAGARHWGYHELHYLGNPGFYQTYILGSNDVSGVGWPPEGPELAAVTSASGDGQIDLLAPTPEWLSFRRLAAPNTFSVVGPHTDAEGLAGAVGVEMDVLRVLPDE